MREGSTPEIQPEKEPTQELKVGDTVRATIKPGMEVDGRTYEGKEKKVREGKIIYIEGDAIRIDIPRKYILEVPRESIEKISGEKTPEEEKE